MKNWQTLQETLERIEKLKEKTYVERKKLVYEWVKTGLISFTVFDELMVYIIKERYELNEKGNTQGAE